ncbi:hypothetical protein HA402_000029 [Bradysia odoriphaga]|nr:hypothetical protein HA402_000029 [Bradysia odoriphaga]
MLTKTNTQTTEDGCTKLTTIDTTRQSLKLTNLQSDSNATLETKNNSTLEMKPFLIRSESGNIAITLSQHLNDTNSRCYQIFIEDHATDKIRMGCLQISDSWNDSRDQKGYQCKKQFVLSQGDVDFVMLFRIYSDGVIELKINNKTRFIYKDRKTPIDVKYISVASTEPDSYNEFYFNCFEEATNTIKYF